MSTPPHLSIKEQTHAFTLTELIVTLSIVVIVAVLAISAVGQVRRAGHTAKSIGNLKQLYLAARGFSEDNQDFLPPITSLYPKGYNDMQYEGALDIYGAEKVKVDPMAPELRIFGYGMNKNLCPISLQWPINGHEETVWGRNHERFWRRSCYKWRNIFRPSAVILFVATAGRNQEVSWYYGDYDSVIPKNGAIRADRHQKGMVQMVACDGHAQMVPLSELSRQTPRSEWWTSGPEGFVLNP